MRANVRQYERLGSRYQLNTLLPLLGMWSTLIHTLNYRQKLWIEFIGSASVFGSHLPFVFGENHTLHLDSRQQLTPQVQWKHKTTTEIPHGSCSFSSIQHSLIFCPHSKLSENKHTFTLTHTSNYCKQYIIYFDL